MDADTGYDAYHGTVITGISWYGATKTAVDSSGGLKAADVFTVRIPLDADFGGKNYVNPKEYPSADPDAVFTLRSGDIIIKGAVTLNNPRPADILASSTEAFTIMGVTDNRRAPNAQHWKVTGA